MEKNYIDILERFDYYIGLEGSLSGCVLSDFFADSYQNIYEYQRAIECLNRLLMYIDTELSNLESYYDKPIYKHEAVKDYNYDKKTLNELKKSAINKLYEFYNKLEKLTR